MAANKENNLIELTISHFQPFYEDVITADDAHEIVNNFTGFARLLLKLDEKRNAVKQLKGEQQ